MSTIGRRLTIDLGAEAKDGHARVIAGLERSAAFAVLADRLGAVPLEAELPQPRVVIRFGQPQEPSPQEARSDVREHFSEYCARYAILAMVTACEEYFGRLLLIAELARLATASGGMMTGEDLNRARDRCRATARRSSVDQLVGKALDRLGRSPNALAGLEWFRSVYRLRTCLTHRGGIVGSEDVGEGDALHARWRRASLLVDGQEMEAVPFTAEAQQVVSVGMADDIRSWQVGEAITLTADDCQQIALSLGFFCGQVLNETLAGVAASLPSQQELPQ